MDPPEVGVGFYVLGLAALLALMLFASHKTHILARDLHDQCPLSLLEHAPLAELSILLFGVTFYSGSHALGFATGVSLSNMIIASAMSIERARVTGFETFPLSIAACLSLWPVGLGIQTAVTTQRVAIGRIIYTIHLQVLLTYMIAVPVWRARKDGSSQRIASAACPQDSAASVDVEDGTTMIHQPGLDSAPVAPTVPGQHKDLSEVTSPTVHDIETQPLLPAEPGSDPDVPDAWQTWNKYQFTLAFLILCSAVASLIIHKLAERLQVSDKHPALLFGLLLATCPSIPTIRTLVLGTPSAGDMTDIRFRCSNNLGVLAAGLLFVGISLDTRDSFNTLIFLSPTILAALFAVLGPHFRGYWWLIGVVPLVFSLFLLAFLTMLALAFGDPHRDDPWIKISNWENGFSK